MISEMYNTVCKDRFESVNSELAEVRADTQYLRRKIDNGLSSVPGDIKSLRSAMKNVMLYGVLPILLLIASGAGYWLYSFGKLEATLNDHITTSTSIMQDTLDDIIREQNKLNIMEAENEH